MFRLWMILAAATAALAQTPAQPTPAPKPDADAAKPAAEAPKPAATADTQPGRTPAASSPVVLEDRVYVRRFSAGATLSFLPFVPVRSQGGFQQSTGLEIESSTTLPAEYRIGFGLNAQLYIGGKLAVAASGIYRQSRHETTTDTIRGVDLPSTTGDERRFETETAKTRTRFYDFNLMLRRFDKPRETPGPRWFVEGGAALRRVANTKTSREIEINNTVTTNNIPLEPTKRLAHGVVGGIGAQFNDEIGIRVMPEFRYTRWLAQTYNMISTITRRDQFEAMVSLTF